MSLGLPGNEALNPHLFREHGVICLETQRVTSDKLGRAHCIILEADTEIRIME